MRPFQASSPSSGFVDRGLTVLAAVAFVVVAGCSSSDPSATSTLQTPQTVDDDLAFADDQVIADPALASPTSTTAGSGLPPVTTIPGPSGDASIEGYAGIVGTLLPDEQVVEPIADPPSSENGRLPLTGLAGDVPDRPAAVVKIDNGAAAAPQTGLNAADIVIEEEVEGGVTRFAAVFHSQSSIIGPVRSGRTTDVALVSGLGTPLFMYSGANDLTETILRRQPHIQNRSHSTSSGYWRDESRRAPSNLYTDIAPHWASASGGPPPAQFAYRLPDEPVEGESVGRFSINYPASTAVWEWSEDHWLRSQRGDRHQLAGGDSVSAANVVVIESERVGTGMFDSAGGAVPEFVYVGNGPATVFTAGRRIDGIWTKPSLSSVATITSYDGEVIELTPGRTWIQLIEVNSGYLQ